MPDRPSFADPTCRRDFLRKRAGAAPVPSAREKADIMDAMHEKGIKAFPARTEGKGNQLLAPRVERGVDVYELTAAEIEWEVEPGVA